MNEILKQRIVGTIVITSIAAIFMPMLFDDPIEGADSYSNELSIPEKPLATSLAMQRQLEDLPRSSDEILSRPAPAQVNLQRENLRKAAKKETHLRSWTIQVASFGQKQNAIEFKDKLIKEKFTAYVDSSPSAKGSVFRLRVGPELNEKIAKKNQRRLEKIYKIKTLLVAN